MSIDKYLEEKAKRKGATIPRSLLSHQSGIKWRRVRCPCSFSVQFSPKKDWDGRLLCPKCGKGFRVPSLDSWVKRS